METCGTFILVIEMFNPLLENPASIKDSELEAKILDLSKKYSIAARMGQGLVCQQIQVIIESYKAEQEKRRLSSLKTNNKDFEELINIE